SHFGKSDAALRISGSLPSGTAAGLSRARRAHSSNANSIITGWNEWLSPRRHESSSRPAVLASNTPRRSIAGPHSVSRRVPASPPRSQMLKGRETPRLRDSIELVRNVCLATRLRSHFPPRIDILYLAGILIAYSTKR